MRILGVDLARKEGTPAGEHTLVLLDADGRLARAQRLGSLPAVVAAVGPLVAGEPFVLGVDVPVVVPARAQRSRRVEALVRRRLGHGMPPGGRTVLAAAARGIVGETLLAALAASGLPCLPYPDRDRRRPGLAETSPELTLKVLLWERSNLAAAATPAVREALLRAVAAPAYRQDGTSRSPAWARLATSLDLLLRALGPGEDFDLDPVRDALSGARSESDVEAAAGLLDALLIAGTARRYVVSPETCLFLGDRESGYLILPADSLVRRLAVSGPADPRGGLFPEASLRERLGPHAALRSGDLLAVPGRPPRVEAAFRERPRYEFDNLDEMLWWKHCRHLSGVQLPTEGLREMTVSLVPEDDRGEPLQLVRSRHRTLSFRFEPAALWRSRIPTRDGRTYGFQVLRAVYEVGDVFRTPG